MAFLKERWKNTIYIFSHHFLLRYSKDLFRILCYITDNSKTQSDIRLDDACFLEIDVLEDVIISNSFEKLDRFVFFYLL